MKHLTASGTPRLAHCVAWMVLPWVKRRSAAAAWGTALHLFLQNCNRLGRERALAEAPPEHRAAFERVPVDQLPVDPRKYGAEVAFAFNVHTEEVVLLDVQGREYPFDGFSDDWVFGTSDVGGVGDESVVVFDYKSGYADLGPVAANRQLLTYSLALARLHKKDSAIQIIIRVHDNEDLKFEEAFISSFELDEHAEWLRNRWHAVRNAGRGVRGAELTFVEGEHCEHCPAWEHCPAKQAIVQSAFAGMSVAPDVLSEETAPILYRRIEAIEQALELAKRTLSEYAAERTVDLGDGWEYGRREEERETVDPLVAEHLLDDAYGLEQAGDIRRLALEVTAKMPKTKLRAAARHIAEKRKADGAKVTIRSVEDELLTILRVGGAVSVRRIRPIKKYRRRKDAQVGPEGDSEGSEVSADKTLGPGADGPSDPAGER